MTYLLLQTFLLLLASYFLGALLACVVKRTIVGAEVDTPVAVPLPVRIEAPPLRPVPGLPKQPVRAHVPAPPVAPRPIDPVQPKIDVLRRPDPRPQPKLIDPARFERALMGPDPNEGMPRRAIVELRPAVLKSPTGPARPWPPAPKPVVQVKAEPPRVAPPPPALKVESLPPAPPSPVSNRPSDATTASAAAAVAMSKAAAAASTTASARPTAPVESQPAPSPPPQQVKPPPTPAAVPSAKQDESKPSAPKPAEVQPAEAPPVVKTVEVKVPIEGGDDFQRIRAVDAELEQQLKAEGVNYFEHIATWTAADVKHIGQVLGIPGRIDREQWVEQAQILAKGGETYYSRNRLAAQKARAPAASTPNAAPALSSPPEPAPAPPAAPQPSAIATAAATTVPTVEMPSTVAKPATLSGVAAASQGRSVAEMAAAAAAAIAAASASVTRGLKPIEPISPLSRVDPKISIPARLTDAIKVQEAASAAQRPDRDAARPAASASSGPAEDLKRIRGIGVLIEKRLNAVGVSRYDEIAHWTNSDIDRVSQMLEFKGRIERESWVEQARILSSGGQTEFSRRVDRGEVDTSRET